MSTIDAAIIQALNDHIGSAGSGGGSGIAYKGGDAITIAGNEINVDYDSATMELKDGKLATKAITNIDNNLTVKGNLTVDSVNNIAIRDGSPLFDYNNKRFIPVVIGNGTMEIGKTIDFHDYASVKDFQDATMRIANHGQTLEVSTFTGDTTSHATVTINGDLKLRQYDEEGKNPQQRAFIAGTAGGASSLPGGLIIAGDLSAPNVYTKTEVDAMIAAGTDGSGVVYSAGNAIDISGNKINVKYDPDTFDVIDDKLTLREMFDLNAGTVTANTATIDYVTVNTALDAPNIYNKQDVDILLDDHTPSLVTGRCSNQVVSHAKYERCNVISIMNLEEEQCKTGNLIRLKDVEGNLHSFVLIRKTDELISWRSDTYLYTDNAALIDLSGELHSKCTVHKDCADAGFGITIGVVDGIFQDPSSDRDCGLFIASSLSHEVLETIVRHYHQWHIKPECIEYSAGSGIYISGDNKIWVDYDTATMQLKDGKLTTKAITNIDNNLTVNGNLTVNSVNDIVIRDGSPLYDYNNKRFIPVVIGNGTMEIGKAIDFHDYASVKDYQDATMRIANNNKTLEITTFTGDIASHATVSINGDLQLRQYNAEGHSPQIRAFIAGTEGGASSLPGALTIAGDLSAPNVYTKTEVDDAIAAGGNAGDIGERAAVQTYQTDTPYIMIQNLSASDFVPGTMLYLTNLYHADDCTWLVIRDSYQDTIPEESMTEHAPENVTLVPILDYKGTATRTRAKLYYHGSVLTLAVDFGVPVNYWEPVMEDTGRGILKPVQLMPKTLTTLMANVKMA